MTASPHSPTVAALQARAEEALAGGSTHISRAYRPALFVDRALAARKWLVDGRELVDYTMGHGALLLGHCHPAVVEAVRRQAGRGTHYGAGHPLEVEWAELIERLVPSVEQTRFTSSGTEATLLAVRLARAFTGRDRVVTLREHFHGWHDAVSVEIDATGARVTPRGVPAAVAALTRVVDPGHAEALEGALADRQVAALLLEASGAHYGAIPLPDGWVAEARRLCDATGTLLIVDEVITGFRVRPGGMQELLGIRPDLTTFGKILAGGLPGGAVGGRREIMDLLATHGRSDAVVRHPGTFNANPLSAAAGIATLGLAADGSVQVAASRAAAALEAVWRDRLAAAGVPGRVWRLASIVHATLDDPRSQARLGGRLRVHGADFFHTSAFVSAVHGDADLELTEAAVAAALADVADPRGGDA